MPARTVFTVLEETASKQGKALALHQPSGTKEGTGYRSFSWEEWLQIARETALGLLATGFRKGEIACILAETRAEFYLADLGILGAGGIAAALYTSYPMAHMAKTIADLAPAALFVEDPKSLAALRAVSGRPLPSRLILLSGEADGARSLEMLRQLGRELEAKDPGAFEAVQRELSPEDPAVLYLTSGATGEPKMGLSSHRAILANLEMAPSALPVGPQDSTLVFLPSAHIAQRIVLEFVPMRMGVPVWFSEGLSKLPAELKRVRPTIFLAPPRVWERMYATINNEVRKRPTFARRVFYTAFSLGMEVNRRRNSGRPVPGWMSRALGVADRMVFSKVRERLGGRVRMALCGAAPLGRELAEFFAAINMPLIEGYGLTEAGVLCFNPLDRPKPGSVGKLLPGVEARLAPDGELQVRTPCLFLGYHRDEQATRAVMTEDDWFATGDLAEVDAEGYWFITGRKKELIVSSNGKKIYPARIEQLFKMEPIVNQVVLLGDKQPYVTALVTINLVNAQALNGMEPLRDRPVEEQIEAPAVTAAVKGAVARVNTQLADFERIRRYRILPKEFTIERGELTPTMKVRRGAVLNNYRDVIGELYLGRDESA